MEVGAVNRSVPERIKDFLTVRQGRMYCDSCIQERLGLKWRQQVQLITATLAVTELFERELVRCCTCNELKQSTRAATRSFPEAPGRAVPSLLMGSQTADNQS
jgi:hypothetical protein